MKRRATGDKTAFIVLYKHSSSTTVATTCTKRTEEPRCSPVPTVQQSLSTQVVAAHVADAKLGSNTLPASVHSTKEPSSQVAEDGREEGAETTICCLRRCAFSCSSHGVCRFLTIACYLRFTRKFLRLSKRVLKVRGWWILER